VSPNPEGAIHDLDKVSLLAKDQPLPLRQVEVLKRFRIGLQALLVGLVGGEAVECNQTPGHIVRAFVREKISDQMPTASRNDATPILGVLPESFFLVWIDLIADHARNRHEGSMPPCPQAYFVYHQTMDADGADEAVSAIAAAIGEPARARMLYSLIDGRARTSTELGVIADVTPSTASVHLQRLQTQRLVKVFAQGKHRYYSLAGTAVAAALEALSVLAGGSRDAFVPNTPHRLRAARTCYDHIAGTLGVSLHDRFKALGWLSGGTNYQLTPAGVKAVEFLGIDAEATAALRRRFAYACVDWSERRPHIGGALGAAMLNVALKRKWVTQDLDSRALEVTSFGRREMLARFGLQWPAG
jgi:DNA-binding transcriptional ArsR family regulator